MPDEQKQKILNELLTRPDFQAKLKDPQKRAILQELERRGVVRLPAAYAAPPKKEEHPAVSDSLRKVYPRDYSKDTMSAAPNPPKAPLWKKIADEAYQTLTDAANPLSGLGLHGQNLFGTQGTGVLSKVLGYPRGIGAALQNQFEAKFNPSSIPSDRAAQQQAAGTGKGVLGHLGAVLQGGVTLQGQPANAIAQPFKAAQFQSGREKMGTMQRITDTAATTAHSMATDPVVYAMMGGEAGLPKPLRKSLSVGFAKQQLHDGSRQFTEGVKEKNPDKITAGLLSAGMGLLIGKHLAGEGISEHGDGLIKGLDTGKMTDSALKQLFGETKKARTPTRKAPVKTDFGRGKTAPAKPAEPQSRAGNTRNTQRVNSEPAAPLARVFSPDSPEAKGAKPFVPPKVSPAPAKPAEKAKSSEPVLHSNGDEVVSLRLPESQAKPNGGLTHPAPAPQKTPAASSEVGLPIQTETIDPLEIGVHPDLQYKKAGVTDTKNQVTDAYKGTTTYDVNQGGTLTVYRDAEGKTYAANSHHRRDLAHRAERFIQIGSDGQPQDVPRRVPIRVLDAKDGWTVESARGYAALENIRDGKGTAIDALEVMQGLKIKPEDFSKMGISTTSEMARNLAGLQAVGPEVLGLVRDNSLHEAAAAGIGSVKGLSEAAQNAAAREAAAEDFTTHARGQRLAQEYLADERSGQLAREQAGAQESMFGDELAPVVRSTRAGRVKIEEEARKVVGQKYRHLVQPTKEELRTGEKIDTEGRLKEAAGMAENASALKGRLDLVLKQDAIRAEIARLAGEVGNGKITRAQAAEVIAAHIAAHIGKPVAALADPGGIKLGDEGDGADKGRAEPAPRLAEPARSEAGKGTQTPQPESKPEPRKAAAESVTPPAAKPTAPAKATTPKPQGAARPKAAPAPRLTASHITGLGFFYGTEHPLAKKMDAVSQRMGDAQTAQVDLSPQEQAQIAADLAKRPNAAKRYGLEGLAKKWAGAGGKPPPDAPVVGGGVTPQGGSGKPGGKIGFSFKLPTRESVGQFFTQARLGLANTFGRGLSRTETEARRSGDVRVLRAARTAAGSEAGFRTMASRALLRVHDAFRGKDGTVSQAGVQQFWNYLAESRLRGARQRYADLRDKVLSLKVPPGDNVNRRVTAKKLPSLADPQVIAEYLDVLEKVQGRRRDSFLIDGEATEEGASPPDHEGYTGRPDDPERFSSRLVDTAKNYLSNRDWQGLQLFLASTLDDLHSSVGVMHDFAPSNPAAMDFDAYGETPPVKQALSAYREEIGNPLTQSYRANKGQESDYLGPLETYYPLIPYRPEGSGTPAPAPAADFAKVKNPAAEFTTGLSERYDTSQEAFLKSAERAMVRNNRGALINTLQDAGLAQVLPRGTRFNTLPQTLRVNGVDVPAVAEPYQGSFTIIKDGKPYRVQSQHILLPKFLADELRPILNSERASSSEIQRALGAVTQAAIIGPTAAVYHAHNLLGSTVAGTPFVGRSFLGKAAGSTPGLKIFAAIDGLRRIDPTAPERAADIQLLARLGQLHPKTAQATASRAVMQATGAKFAPQSAGLYGIGGMDLRTRLMLLDVAREMHRAKGTTPTEEELFDFVAQAGTYTRGLDSSLERSLKGAGIAPFITAGKTQVATGLRSLTGTTRLPTKGLPVQTRARLRAQQALSGGIAGYTALWLSANYLYNGRLPDRKDKFGQVRIKPEDRNSPAGQMLFGAGHDEKRVSVAFFDPTLARGAKAAMLEAYINGTLQGKDADQIAENMQRDALNSWASPVTTSPTVRLPSVLLTGKEPYITSLSQRKPYQYGGKKRESKIEFIEEVGEEETGIHRIALQMKEAALKANPVGDMIGQISGMGHRRPDREKDTAGRMAIEAIFDLAFPRLEAFTYPKKPGGVAVDRSSPDYQIQQELKRSLRPSGGRL